MNMTTNPYTHAICIANQTRGSLYATLRCDIELPNPNDFKNGDVLMHGERIYVNNNSCWYCVADNDRTILNSDVDKQKETDPAPWLALLE